MSQVTKKTKLDVTEVYPINNVNDFLESNARGPLMNLYRHLVLRHDYLGQEIILAKILANLVHAKLFDQAYDILRTCPVQQPYKSNCQAARIYFYTALINAIRLEYNDALIAVQTALRKAPERAKGFRIAATKLKLTIQLLLGDIPPRSDFLASDIRTELDPYLQLASCVRFGQLNKFHAIIASNTEDFETDCTHSLILRMRQTVLKTALRRICQSYEAISLNDIALKLSLSNPEDAEYIVAKAIFDGVISASIDHEKGILYSKHETDIYCTSKPLQALQSRINYLNLICEEAKRAMKYSSLKQETVEEAKKRKEEWDELDLAEEDEEFDF